jgi:hypothetical protein
MARQLTSISTVRVERSESKYSTHRVTLTEQKDFSTMAAGVTNRLWNIEDVVGLLPELHYNTRPQRSAG